MATSVLVPEQEYLTTSYEPDCEYDEGVLLEHSLGEQPHSILQSAFASFFFERRKSLGLCVLTGQRIRIAPRKYRIPDTCVYLQPAPRDRVLGVPPFIAIEILSSEDRASRVRKKIDEFLEFGVRYVWLIDPLRRRADVYTASGFYEVKDGILRTENRAVEVPLAELFQTMDE